MDPAASLPVGLLLALSCVVGACGREPAPQARAAFRALITHGEKEGDFAFGGKVVPGSHSAVGVPRTTLFEAPPGPARIEGLLALRKHAHGFSGDHVDVRVSASVGDGTPVTIATRDLHVPLVPSDNGWHEFAFEIPEAWRGEQVRIDYASAFRDPEDPQPTSLAIGGPFLRTHGVRGPPPADAGIGTPPTTRAGMIGAYGRSDAHTPVLDRLAAEGTLFETAYATANATCPSHASLFTSLYLKDHGVVTNSMRLHHDALTLAELLRADGYETRAVLSVRMLGQLAGLDQGFASLSGPTSGEWPGSSAVRELERTLPERAGAPLFLWVHLFDPHTPYDPPERARARFPGASGPAGAHEAEVERYRAEVSETDTLVGEVLALLAERGYDRPIVVVTADHGESLGEHGVSYKHEGIYSVVTRVPLILSGPRVPSGVRVRDGYASLVDVMPTLLDLVGVRCPQPLRGRSLLPVARGKRPAREVVYIEQIQDKAVGLRTLEHLYLRVLETHQEEGVVHPEGEERLFVLDDDPGEVVDRAAGLPELTARFRAETQAWLDQRVSSLSALRQTLSPELAAELRAMGYTVSDDVDDGSEQ